MAKLLKLRRGTTSQHSSFTGAEGEVTVDTTKDTAVVHDGSQAGGRPLLREDLDNIGTGVITAAMLAANSVDSSELVNGSVDHDHLSTDCIDGTNIQDSVIESEHYADGSIDHEHLAGDCIDGDNIGDDVINSEHIAADSLDAEHYAPGSVDTTALADDGVTLAKMAGIARGKIIYGDASGNPAVLAVGSADQVITTDGTDISWGTAAAGASGGGSDTVFWENGQTVTTNYTITNNTNAGSFGPITINSGITVTVGSGENWTVV